MGETKQLSATVKDQNGNTMSGASVSWSTSDPSVATVSSAGLVTATANGMATITSTSGSASATASVTVQEEAAALPDTEIDSGPATGSTQRESEAAFSFFSDQFDTDFECSLDGGAWSACGMTSEGDFISKVGYTGLGEGGHTFEVRAVNSIGSDPTPASRTWSVDTTGDSGILQLVSSTTVAGADIWSGLSFDGSHILLTTMINGHINLVKYTTDLVQVGDAVALTTASDIPAGKNIADHKHLLMGSTLFVSWSPSGDKELYLFRTDTDGNRVGPQVAVVEDSPVMTNDMHLFTNGASVFVMYAEAGEDRYITEYDTALVAAGPTKKITAPGPHDPLGATLFQNGGYRMFGGNGTNRHLIVANWTSTWSTEEPYDRVIVASTTDDWNWFASGVEWDPTTKRWFIGYRHMESGEDSDTQGKLRLAVFDEKYGLLDRLQIPLNKMAVALPGVAPVFGQEQRCIVQQPYALMVGGTHARKNIDGALAAFYKVAQDVEHNLVVVGRPGELEPADWGERVIRFEWLGNTQLAGIYQHADVLIHSAYDDGTGICILEAIESGCLIASGRVGAVPEIAGDAPLYFNPESEESMVGVLRRAMQEDGGERLRRVKAGKQQIVERDWERCAWKLLSLFSKSGI